MWTSTDGASAVSANAGVGDQRTAGTACVPSTNAQLRNVLYSPAASMSGPLEAGRSQHEGVHAMTDPLKRWVMVGVVALAVIAGGLIGLAAAGNGSGATPSGSAIAEATISPTPNATPRPSDAPTPDPTPTPTATPVPTPTPEPTPIPVPAPLTGQLVAPALAAQHPIAVMVDDLGPARPQSGFNSAAVVWQAPAEGGIPRYMMIFQDQIPKSIGPVRSARYYYIAWAAEWKAVYAHVGGSPQAMQTLRAKGSGQLVYNADEFRWGGYFHRTKDRFAPHNMYTEGKTLRKLAKRVGAADKLKEPVWQFGPDAPLSQRPKSGTIAVGYPANSIKYTYDRKTNSYYRAVTREKKQVDAATGKRVHPKNVIVMIMQFGPLNDGHPNKHRLEAQVVGKGKAWIATNGHTIVGTWRKKSLTAPTLFYDAKGHQVTLTVGQTFIQVLKQGSRVTIKDGKVPPRIRQQAIHRGQSLMAS
jgi:Protein of unknown function (DUF3048) N-terminal domain/Protein of unknown function (DUF3048) C-terminal domain